MAQPADTISVVIPRGRSAPAAHDPAEADRTPTISIVLIGHPGSDTASALDHLNLVTSGHATEVIVVEPPRSSSVGELSWARGSLLTVPTDEGLDPAIALNAGVEHASAATIVVLDMDARPEPGCLDTLLDVLGTSGSAVVGTTPAGGSTAGLIVFSDASVSPGPVIEPGPTVEVDAVGAECFAVRAGTWRAHRGLDGRYSLPGLALVDFCFRVRSAGSAVLAATGARVTALPSAPSPAGDELRFRTQWAQVLSNHEPPPGPWGPIPDDTDRRSRPVGLSPRVRRPGPRDTATALVIGPSADTSGPAADRAGRVHRLLADVGWQPFDPSGRTTPDVVWLVSEAAVRAQAVASRRLWPKALVVADVVAVESAHAERLATLSGQPPGPDIAAIQARERLWYGTVDVVVTPTSADQAALSDLVTNAPIELLGDVVDPAMPGSPSDREGVLWWADFTQDHNVDAAHWLCREILPRSQSGRHRTPAFLAGPGCNSALRSLVGNGVTITDGDDVDSLTARARMVVCPLRHGSGAAVRAGLGTASGLPLVGTSLGVDAAGLTPGVGAWVADDADGFARAIVELHRDDDRWSAMAHAARDELLRRRTAVTSTLLELLRR